MIFMDMLQSWHIQKAAGGPESGRFVTASQCPDLTGKTRKISQKTNI